jgi:hypothetical protein
MITSVPDAQNPRRRYNSRLGAALIAPCLAVLSVPTVASAAVTFGAGAGASLTITSIAGDTSSLAQTAIVGTETRTVTVAGDNGPDEERSFRQTRSFDVDPTNLGAAEATASARALSVTLDADEPASGDDLIGTGLFQLAEVEGSASAVGSGFFADAFAEADAVGAYDITNRGADPIEVRFDYDVSLAALSGLDDPATERVSALASVEIEADDARGLIFANNVGSQGNGGAEAMAMGSFAVEIAGFSSLVVGSVSNAFGEASVVPLPGAVWMLLAGIGSLGWLRRRARLAIPAAAGRA